MRARTIDRLVATDAPPAPPCFETSEQWRDWLLLAYDSGERVVRRQDLGKHLGKDVRKVSTVFAIAPLQQCKDCQFDYAQRMAADGRCQLAQILAGDDWHPLKTGKD